MLRSRKNYKMPKTEKITEINKTTETLARELVCEYRADSWISPDLALTKIAEKYLRAERDKAFEWIEAFGLLTCLKPGIEMSSPNSMAMEIMLHINEERISAKARITELEKQVEHWRRHANITQEKGEMILADNARLTNSKE